MKQQGKVGAKLKQRRQEMGFSQKKLAEQLGCTPSALCMFEGGKPEALSVERLKKACEVLELEPGSLLGSSGTFHYCPNPLCPTHHPYAIGDEAALKPEPISTTRAKSHCGWCGEPLLTQCESCNEAFDPEHAFCAGCGHPYVILPDEYEPSQEILNRLQRMREEHTAFSAIQKEEQG